MSSMKVKVLQDTYFKQSTEQSDKLTPDKKMLVNKDQEFGVKASLELEDDQHVKITLDKTVNKFNTWIAFLDHVELIEDESRTSERDEIGLAYGEYVLFDDLTRIVLSAPVYQGSAFTWAELTHKGTRLPPNKTIYNNMIRIAKKADEVRSFLRKELKKPDLIMVVTSGYRPKKINDAIGGAKQSRHLVGDALDVIVPGVKNTTLYNALSPWYIGGLGIYGGGNPCLHLDNRLWRARWNLSGKK
jgi:Peptidase M15